MEDLICPYRDHHEKMQLITLHEICSNEASTGDVEDPEPTQPIMRNETISIETRRNDMKRFQEMQMASANYMRLVLC